MKQLAVLILLFLGGKSIAQNILGVDTLINNGPIDKRINLVIIGDGYTLAEMPQFINDAKKSANYLLSTSPFGNYKKYFNVFAIKVESPQSGVSHPGTATDVVEPQSPVMSVTNNFNTCFDNYGVHRSIVAVNASAVYAVLASAFPAYDQVLVLGNSTEYGGTGGPIAVSSIHPSSPEIVVHEMGHSFAGLADEYWAGTVFALEKPNMTMNMMPATVKWSQWLNSGGIGIYPYDNFSPADKWFRPHQNCKMQFLNVPFCSVCKQTIIEKIHAMVSPLDGYYPDNSGPESFKQWFKGIYVKPAPNTLRRVWNVNGNDFARNKDSVMVPGELMFVGDNMLTLTVVDTTLMSRDTSHITEHSYSVVWTVSYSTVGIKRSQAHMEFSIFPNPASETLNLNYTLLQESEIGIRVTDMSGKTVLAEEPVKEPAGQYKRSWDVKELKAGNYLLELKINNKAITNKFIIAK